MRSLLLSVIVACGGAAPEPARPHVSCGEVIGPMIDRRVAASVAEIARRERLPEAEHERLDRLVRQRAEQLSATMIRTCNTDQWSSDALACFDRARNEGDLRGCDRHLSATQRQHLLSATE